MPAEEKPTPSGVRLAPQATRLELYRNLRPFADLPSFEEASAAIERRRKGGYDVLERYICRLTLTAQRVALADTFGGKEGPHDLGDLWGLIHREQRWLDREGHSADRLRIEQAARILAEGQVNVRKTGPFSSTAEAVHNHATFCEAARSMLPPGGKDPGGALWKSIQRIGSKHFDWGDHMPERYTRFEGFQRLVHDLRGIK